MNQNDSSCSTGCTGIMWWATLVVAVIAVPTFAFTVTKILGVTGMMEIAVFMITCWVCTYLGMVLMKNPKVSEKFTFKK